MASFATLPIFAAEAIVGQSLYSNPTSGKRSVHIGVSAALGGLFAVNTVTGVWNLLQPRKDPHFGLITGGGARTRTPPPLPSDGHRA